MHQFNANEVRVLGCLMEKAVTTPDYYPLTINALVSACNQKSNRDPVVNFDEDTVARSLVALRERKLVWENVPAGSRTCKYAHSFDTALGFSEAQSAVLCVLMLRGPQTVGEIRGRTGRMFTFDDLAQVEATLTELAEREDGALVVKLPRQAGRKDSRFAHLLCGEPEVTEAEPAAIPSAATLAVSREGERIAALEEEVRRLASEFEDLQGAFEKFRRQFE